MVTPFFVFFYPGVSFFCLCVCFVWRGILHRSNEWNGLRSFWFEWWMNMVITVFFGIIFIQNWMKMLIYEKPSDTIWIWIHRNWFLRENIRMFFHSNDRHFNIIWMVGSCECTSQQIILKWNATHFEWFIWRNHSKLTGNSDESFSYFNLFDCLSRFSCFSCFI